MKEVRRKVLLDLFASPLTLLPIVGGLTVLLAAWATRSAPLTFAGLAGILGGIGVFANRMIFGLEKLTNRAHEYVLEQQQQLQVESLRALEGKLRKEQATLALRLDRKDRPRQPENGNSELGAVQAHV